jgi:hypothetical protein
MIKSRIMRWAEHVARMGKRKTYRIWSESQKERDHLEGKGEGGWIISKWILER